MLDMTEEMKRYAEVLRKDYFERYGLWVDSGRLCRRSADAQHLTSPPIPQPEGLKDVLAKHMTNLPTTITIPEAVKVLEALKALAGTAEGKEALDMAIRAFRGIGVALLCLLLTGCANVMRPAYCTPELARELREKERTALAMQEATGYLGPAMAVGGLLWQLAEGSRAGPVVLASTGAAAGAVAAGAGSYASSVRAEYEACRDLPAGVEAALVPEVKP